ncbi:DmX-like protein 1 [Xenoophorus captivus]|uniref:DmX-like protein 1 n=1 Tax=Xenoophorus captivus TaxID=1517983 RepID=A0ABV0QVG2_9TELE
MDELKLLGLLFLNIFLFVFAPRNLGTGVMQIEVGPASHIFSCGADGTMKMRTLPNRFAVAENNSSSPKSDVKFFI